MFVCLQCLDTQRVVSLCFAQRTEATKEEEEEEEPDVVLVKVEKMEEVEPVTGTQTGLSIQEGEWTESPLGHACNM